MKRVWLVVALLILVSVAQEAVGQTVVPVRWTGMVNATAVGNSLQNVGGPGGGGFSAQHLASGNGYVEVTVTDPAMDYVVSLGPASSTGFVGVYALHLAMYGAEVRENNWTLEANTVAIKGDVFRIAVVNGQVQYKKNGTVFYTSATPPTPLYPLMVQASLWSFGATVSNANLSATGWARAPTWAPTLSAVNPHERVNQKHAWLRSVLEIANRWRQINASPFADLGMMGVEE